MSTTMGCQNRQPRNMSMLISGAKLSPVARGDNRDDATAVDRT